MALSSTTYAIEFAQAASNDNAVTSTSRTYNTGELVVVNYGAGNNNSGGTQTFVIANSGTAQTWNVIGSRISTPDGQHCTVAAWWCIMSTTQAMTITTSFDNNRGDGGFIGVEVLSGQHATTPFPAGNVYTGQGGTDVTQSITPTSAGSMLRFWCGDWSATNTFTAATNCTVIDTHHEGSYATFAWVRPTTDPRADASAFSIGEADTGGKVSWLAYEIQAAAGGGGSPIGAAAYYYSQQ